ncbi:hypothetical protein AALO_G00002420 [Alosa alosa]|uniref:Uncharacterized protein n=1 Tax=Alosa alosa TaxID=278164 RepID=A0AAV6HH08_9TELE|nr:hypothetical protein AALO_G00002420 [Alosa alosa]
MSHANCLQDCKSCLLLQHPYNLLQISQSLLCLKPPKQTMEVTVGACAGLAGLEVLYSAHCWLQHISPAKRTRSKTRGGGGRRYGARLHRKSVTVDLSQVGPQIQDILGLDAAVAPLTLRALAHKIRQVSHPPNYRLISYQQLDPWSSDLLPIDDQPEDSDPSVRLTDSMSRVLNSNQCCTD